MGRVARARVVAPGDEIGVLDGQRGQLGGAGLGLGRDEFEELVDEDLSGPAVADDVVPVEEQGVVVGGGAQQRRADQRAGPQVEGAPGVLFGDAPRLGGTELGVQPCEVDQLCGQRQFRLDVYARYAAVGGEAGAQDVVPADDLAHRPGGCAGVERSGETDRRAHVVQRGARMHPVQEPEAFLGG